MDALVSIIIPTHNRGETLDRTVRALWRQTINSDRLEIVVIDNASDDDTREWVERLRSDSPISMRYHRIDTDRGPAGARNCGAHFATGKTLLFLDSDVELHCTWIDTALSYLDRHPATGIVAGKLLYATQPTLVNMFGGELNRIGLAWDAHEREPANLVCTEQECLWTPTAAMMVRRDVLDRIGAFDDTFYFGFEDSDLGWRANLAGFRCVCCPDLVALHHATPSGRTAGRTIVFHYTKNRLRSMLKNYSAGSLAKYIPLYLVYTLGELFVRPSRGVRLKALLWNAAKLKSTWRERGHVQRVRRRQDRDLAHYFTRRWLPPATLARRRKDEWQLLTQCERGPVADLSIK
jgi:GT2 family glycosyltransferase